MSTTVYTQDDPIGDQLLSNSCTTALVGWIVEDFVTQSGDPRLWGEQPNMALLNELVDDCFFGVMDGDIEAIARYIWETFIVPLRHELTQQWEGLLLTCPHCEVATTITFKFAASADTTYEEVCPQCHRVTRSSQCAGT